MRINRNLSTLFLLLWLQCVLSEKEERTFLKNHKHKGGHGGGGYGYGGGGKGGGGGGGYGHNSHGGKGGGYGHDSHGGGYGDEHVYKPQKCHPQTVTKYNTIYKERKAQVVNQVEVLNPKPHVKVVTETRYTTIRYPVFITQVIKPLLTQVETKVKPIFFTKTIDKYTTVLFTVTGIGQVTVTSVKYEKEYITRCMKKGYHHKRSYNSQEGPEVKEMDLNLPIESTGTVISHESDLTILPYSPPEVVYRDNYDGRDIAEGIKSLSDIPVSKDTPEEIIPRLRKRKRNQVRSTPFLLPLLPPRNPVSPLSIPQNRVVNRKGEPVVISDFNGRIGNVGDLYTTDFYYSGEESRRDGRDIDIEPSDVIEISELKSVPHPPLFEVPLVILE